jgi:hypothetical protein
MQVPQWLTFMVAGVIILFGVYRVRLYLHGAEKYKELSKRGAMYRIPRRTHLFMGIVFLLLGAWLVATALGFGPFA